MSKVDYPIKKILEDIAKSHKVPLKHFTQEHFLCEAQKDQFPLLADLSIHLAYPCGLGIEIKKDNMTAFEGVNGKFSLAYFGRGVEEYSNITKEFGLVYSDGRRIHITLNENEQGHIEIRDKKIEEARYKLNQDSFGSSFDEYSKATFGFRQKGEDRSLPGIKAFLEYLLK